MIAYRAEKETPIAFYDLPSMLCDTLDNEYVAGITDE